MKRYRMAKTHAVLLIIFFLLLSDGIRAQDTCKPQLGRIGFIQELLFPQGTARTHQFDDYTEDSYHVDKLDLLEGVRSIRSDEHVAGLIVLGPFGGLWTYQGFLFVAEKNGIRLNFLIFPHARITHKATRLISQEEYKKAIVTLSTNKIMIKGMPSYKTMRGGVEGMDLEWNYSLLFADWSTGTERIWHSKGDRLEHPEQGLEPLVSALDRLRENSTTTYETTLPEKYETIICPKK
jgi:hypothetical protein